MEVVIKLYKDKPSKLGVKFPQEYLAVKAYEDIMRKNVGSLFFAEIEMVKNKINLLLKCEQTGTKIMYKDLEYKVEQLKRLVACVKPGDDLQFVHVYTKANTMMIAKAFRLNKFISLKSFEVIGPNNFASGM